MRYGRIRGSPITGHLYFFIYFLVLPSFGILFVTVQTFGATESIGHHSLKKKNIQSFELLSLQVNNGKNI